MMTMRVWIDPRKVKFISKSEDGRWVEISVAGSPERFNLHKDHGVPFVDLRTPYHPLAVVLHEEILCVTIRDYIDPPTKFLSEGRYQYNGAEVTVKSARDKNEIMDYRYQIVFVWAINAYLAREIHSLVLERRIAPVEAWS